MGLGLLTVLGAVAGRARADEVAAPQGAPDEVPKEVPEQAPEHLEVLAAGQELVDDAGHFRGAYAVSPGDWVLVRPDGYIGAFVGSQETDALMRYLADQGLV